MKKRGLFQDCGVGRYAKYIAMGCPGEHFTKRSLTVVNKSVIRGNNQVTMVFEPGQAEMEFDIVIATRNRISALELSLPLMLNQSRLPKSLIIVDSSDDHPKVKLTVENIVKDCPSASAVSVSVIRSSIGSSLQRNIGLARVQSPVVFFPDDDSLWFPGVSESVMAVYEKDADESVGAVCQAESIAPPIQIWGNDTIRYHMTLMDRFKLFYDSNFDVFERSFFPDPLLTAGKTVWGWREIPAPCRTAEVEQCGVMSGFRMTFRSDLIRSLGGFDESLGNYAMFEDRDASLRVLKTHMILCAKRAKVFHYRSPEKRTSGFEFGMMNVLNRAYITCKSFDAGIRKPRRDLQRFLAFKLLRYGLQSYSKYGRERFTGAYRAYSLVPHLLKASSDQLTEQYLMTKRECLAQW